MAQLVASMSGVVLGGVVEVVGSNLARGKIYIYTEGYSESTEPIDAVNILPLARLALILTTTDAVRIYIYIKQLLARKRSTESAQTCQSLQCSYTQRMGVAEGSGQN